MQLSNFIDVFLVMVLRAADTQDHHPIQKLGAENHTVQLNIQCS